jgi:TonB-linked SusC/RagA family outer membrane protein
MKFTLRSPKVWGLAACFLLFLSETRASEHRSVKGMFNISASKKSLEQAPVKGVVKDETGLPLPGVSVKVKGTSRGTQTGVDGQYALDAQPGEILVFSFVGYNVKEVTVGTGDTANVVLTPSSKNLTEVVVTALGITKTSASLSYDQQTVSGKELEVAKDPSFVNSLDGKVSGLQITQSSSGAGGSTKVILRGNKSINGSSGVLYVVDGIPLNSLTSGQPNGPFSYGPDGGDGISNINPDDIESISVLKGASASALYGSAAANGVILITTKKGKAGKTTLTLSSNTTFDSPVLLPKLQNEYGQGDGDTTNVSSVNSWGPKEGGAYHNPKDFFNTGISLINSFTLSTGTEKNQTFVSYANTHVNGIEPGNIFNKNNISIHNTSKLLNDKMTLDLSANYISQNTVDRPTSGTYFNPLPSLYLFPRSVDFNQYKNYQMFDPSRNINIQNWILPDDKAGSTDLMENPYWIQYRNPTTQGLNRLLATISAKYDITNWMNIQGRIKLDKADQTSDQKLYAGSVLLLSGPAGNYNYSSTGNNQVYSDLLLNVNKDLSSDFNINGTLGASIQDNQFSSLGFGGHLGNIDNYFNVSNVILTAGNPFNQTNKTENQTQSVFASVDFGYKKFLYLDVTARNDWASALAYTNHNSFFYPSVGLSDVLSSMFKMPDFISYSKIRVSYTGVGNSIPTFVSTPSQYTLSSGFLNLNLIEPLGTLKPERTNSFEAGTEWRFFNDHLSFDATYYNTSTKNQLFTVNASRAGGFSGYYINAGDVKNEGFEGSLGYHGTIAHDLTWNSTFTFSMNKNKVIALYTDNSSGTPNVITRFQFPSAFDSYSLEARVGHPFGEIYARDFARDASGNIILANGLPKLQDSNPVNYTDVGNSNPKFILGWTNSFRLKQLDLAFTIDGRFGGKVVDMTQAYLDAYGVSQASAIARDNGGVLINGTSINPQSYYQIVGGRTGALAQYAYSATNIRLREASLGYTFPASVFSNKIQSIRLALTGRNLFFFYLKAPYDPETTLSTDNGLQGIDLFGQPSVRSIGFNITARF